jgi:hypothetical protein
VRCIVLTGSDKALLLVRISKKWRTKPSSKCTAKTFWGQNRPLHQDPKADHRRSVGYVLGVVRSVMMRFYHASYREIQVADKPRRWYGLGGTPVDAVCAVQIDGNAPDRTFHERRS